ncbi:MAG: glutamate--tRNA ligase [Pseudotabrizicola sp.]|uniref:glutamate--tRNA ligase n=1 Tax=Pseudotabrizicola sp. TaxID=2939647 RepID=UPI00272804BB|nr:glutamate--tRNA ligase [Pseudotabrizicola sp.]MDO8881993.1 glutamate--tRNA ligase [Pseudotabrizicola sp.]MDP2080872.1 glutamate--tRNA ligase [Pseudotabrizicola sp.]MDZ7572726.1 glutamate--tRNA ligase [Pseudotabrizicola sp.]
MSSPPIVTRFAPSPTGYLHIGGARTALFNWLFARGRGGKFLLRIEDTDRERSTPEATAAILQGLTWLGLDWDGEAVSQFDQRHRHAQVAHEMLDRGTAYRCFSTQDEIAAFRAAQEAAGVSYAVFQSPWRDADPATHPDAPYAIRMKAPRTGETKINDTVQGIVTVRNDQLDDMIVLRSDGNPTYMLAVVVDDHDMGVTHVIRGDDHLNNAARQQMVYDAMDWAIPVWAHIPLIHGPDGKKLSKRHGATAVGDYQAQGYPAAGMRNYLTRLGWAQGDAELFTTDQAKEMFGLEGIGRSPARLDFKKLESTCGWHLARTDDAALLHEIDAYLAAANRPALTVAQRDLLLRAMYCVKDRAKTFPELIDKAQFALTSRPIDIDEAAGKALDDVSRGILKELTLRLQNASWTKEELESILTEVATAHGIGFGKLAAPLRAALAGRSATPSVYDMMLVIGLDETIARLQDAAA